MMQHSHHFRDFRMSGDLTLKAPVVRAMSIREIRDELKKRGVDMTGCLEKEDLVALLLANWHMALPHQEPSPAAGVPIRSGSGCPPTASMGGGGSTGSSLPATAVGNRCSSRPPAAAAGSSSIGSCQQHGRGRSSGGSGQSSRQKYMESVGLCSPCEHCSNEGKMLHCSECGSGCYCSKACQVACWPEHKKTCKQRVEIRQRAEDAMGAGMVKALRTWTDHNVHWLSYMATALLWLPPPPRYATHVLFLELHCDNSTEAKPKFAVRSHKVITLEQLNAYRAESSGGPGVMPEGPPDEMLILLVCTTTSSGGTASTSPTGLPHRQMSLMESVSLGLDLQSDLLTGRQKLPSLARIVAELSKFSS